MYPLVKQLADDDYREGAEAKGITANLLRSPVSLISLTEDGGLIVIDRQDRSRSTTEGGSNVNELR